MQSPKVYVGESRFGRGLFTVADIDPNEFIAEFDGPEYEARCNAALPTLDVANHAIQIARNRWKDSLSGARFVNHSCEPNAGIRGTTILVAMRKILAGQEIFFDYDMTERSDYSLVCECRCKQCRRIIGTYDNLPAEKRAEYGDYVSEWIRAEERKASL